VDPPAGVAWPRLRRAAKFPAAGHRRRYRHRRRLAADTGRAWGDRGRGRGPLSGRGPGGRGPRRGAQPIRELARSLLWTEEVQRETYAEIVETFAAVMRGARVCVVLYGHPGISALPGHRRMVARVRAAGLPARMLPAVSA